MSAPTIAVIGSANMDLVTRLMRCPRPGETLLGKSFTTAPGGKGANQAVAAARLGAQVRFVGRVGRDVFGEKLRGNLAAEGIDVTHLETTDEAASGTAVIFVADEGQNSIVVTPGANHCFRPADLEALESQMGDVDAVLLQLEIPLDTVEAALALARRHGVLSVLDAGAAQQVPPSIIQLSDVVSPNETEAEAITGIAVTGIDDAREAASKILEMGAREVVMKLGSRGALYMGDDWFHVPAYPVTPVDTVAAGDAFTAALTIAWRSQLHKRDALRYANAAGALATLNPGAQDAMPRRAEVNAFLEQQQHPDARPTP